MEKSNKLVNEICARFRHGLYILHGGWNYEWDDEMSTIERVTGVDEDFVYTKLVDTMKNYEEYSEDKHPISTFDDKLFLRPLTSMTDKEKDELFQLMGNGSDVERIDFYISHHFDYRCLIGKDLALEAHEWMYAPHFGDMKVTVDVEHKGNKL